MLDPNKAPQSLAEMAQRSFVKHADQPFLGSKAKSADRKTESEYVFQTFAQVGERVKNLACGLLQMELARGDRALILAENRPEWALSDLALQMIGAVTVPSFSTLPSSQVRGVVEDSGAIFAFVSTASQLEKIVEFAPQTPALRAVILMDEAPSTPPALPENVRFLSLAELENAGREYSQANEGLYETTWPAAQSDDLATIIYTSGTTGTPKGAMLSHRNFISNVLAIHAVLAEAYNLKDETFLSFLPLAHIYERTGGYYLPLQMGASIAYCESLFTIDKNMREARPTFMMCVPRLYETMRDKLFSAADSMDESKKAKYLDALQLASKAGNYYGHKAGAPAPSFIEKIKLRAYDVLVFSKIRDKFGGRMRAFISGGAPMPVEIGALFTGIGVTLLEGYGLTETSPVMAVNRPGRVRLGTVGEVLKSVEVKIADDGEIITRGDSIFSGYWNKPQETSEALQDGWFHTGDIGALDGDVLRITDRKKDLLVLANGKKVAPAPIEIGLAKSNYIVQAVLLGDKQKAVSALIVPDLEALREYSRKQTVHYADDVEMLAAPEIMKLVRAEIDAHSGDLADFEKVRKVVLVPEPFSVEGGELTPTLKVKRKVVAEKYATQLEG